MKEFVKQISCNRRLLCVLMKIILVVTMVLLIGYSAMRQTIFFYRKPIYKPIFGGLNQYDLVLRVGDTYHLYVFDINKRVSFESSDIKVATVNLLGCVRAWRPGTTVIKVRYDDKLLKCKIRVVDLNCHSIMNRVGAKKRLYVKKGFWGVRYKSSNTSVATVNRFGVVHSVGKGKAVITATYKGKKMRCKVIVKK